MGMWPFVLVVTALLAVGIAREPRSFWNALFLMLDLVLAYLAMCVAGGVWMKLAEGGLLLVPVIFFGFAGFLIVNGVKILRKERRSLSNALALLLGLFMVFGGIGSVVGLIVFQEVSVQRSLYYLVLLIECYLAFSFAALFVYAWLYTLVPKRINCDYIIVHGCGLKNGEEVTPLLRGRVDKAVEVCRHAKSHPKLVLSGGTGRDEKISEAQAMKNYLLAQGFPEEDLLLEDRSGTTYENLRNVRDMLDTGGVRHRYIFVTNNYHVFRTGLFARRLKMNAQGVGCRTASYYWPSAFIREYIAILAQYKWIFGAIVLVWALLERAIHLA